MYIPKQFKFQWHITEQCNLRCRHCYQEGFDRQDPEPESLNEVFSQIKSLAEFWKTTHPQKQLFHISLTGGEPFLSDHLLSLITDIACYPKLFRYSILSNGTVLDEKHVKHLMKFPPAYVQVSIEGSREIHDSIRGIGTYDKAVKGIQLLRSNTIPVSVSFTASRCNYRDFPSVARLGRKLKVMQIWADRVIPWGAGKTLENSLMTPEDTREFHSLMNREMVRLNNSWFSKTRISMHRSLQFQEGGGRPYSCSAGKRIVAIMPDGTLYPCRRMPVPLGNLFETDIKDLFYNNTFLKRLRDPDKTIEGCEGCFYKTLCAGGLKCLSYAMYGDPFKRDPGCLEGK